MIFLLANTVFLALSVGYGWLAGDRLEKEACAWIVAALLGTLAATTLLQPIDALGAILAVDLLLLAAIVWIAFRSPRYWPTWFAGLHLAGVILTIAALVAAPPNDQTLRILAGFWGIPALLSMVLGLFLDRRAEQRTGFAQ